MHSREVPIIHRALDPTHVEMTHKGTPIIAGLGLSELIACSSRFVRLPSAEQAAYCDPGDAQLATAGDVFSFARLAPFVSPTLSLG